MTSGSEDVDESTRHCIALETTDDICYNIGIERFTVAGSPRSISHRFGGLRNA